MGFASGDMAEFISKPSFRGFVFQYRHPFTPNIAAGFDLGWNVFYERKDYDTYEANNASLSGVQFRYHNEIPLYISGEYYFKPEGPLNPFAGLGIGTIYSERNTDMGVWRVVEDAWQFALKPEVGLLYMFNESAGFKLAAKYNLGFAGGDLDAQSFIAIDAGLAFGF
jgi:outer membrane protein